MKLADFTESQLIRIHRRLDAKVDRDCFGADWHTLRIVRPSLHDALQLVFREWARRQQA